jgi:type I restriction enzyme S subunit
MIGEGRTRGQAAILDVAATHNQNAASIRVSETPIPPEYVYWWLEHRYDITRALGVGGNQPALNKARVQAIPIPVPPLDEALEIVRRLENQLNELGLIPPELDEAAARAVELRQTVLAAAFRGEFTA